MLWVPVEWIHLAYGRGQCHVVRMAFVVVKKYVEASVNSKGYK
jgi:hypothetical protein